MTTIETQARNCQATGMTGDSLPASEQVGGPHSVGWCATADCRHTHPSTLEEGALPYEGAQDGKHYWLTPEDLMAELQDEFAFDFDACPYPKPDAFDGLTADWGSSTWVNPPFGSIIQDGKKKGPTAWARKAIAEYRKGNRVVMVFPLDKWILMLLAAGATVRNLGDVKWCATEDGQPGKGNGRWTAMFVLDPTTNRRERVNDAAIRLQMASDSALINELAERVEAAERERDALRGENTMLRARCQQINQLTNGIRIRQEEAPE